VYGSLVLAVGERFENVRLGVGFEVLSVPVTDGALELRLTLEPGHGKALAHLHEDFVERFAVEVGNATARVAGRTLHLGPGDELEVPAGSAHVNPHNASKERLVFRQRTEPATPFALSFFETLGRMTRDGRVDRRGQLPLLAAFAIAHATQSRTFAAGVPRGLQRHLLFPVGYHLARLRGYGDALAVSP